MKSTIYVNKQAHNNKKLGSKGCFVCVCVCVCVCVHVCVCVCCVCVCVCGHMMKLKY